MRATSGDWGDWGRLGKIGRDAESGGHCYRLEGAGGSRRDRFREELGLPGRPLDTVERELRVLESRGLTGSKGRLRAARAEVGRRQLRSGPLTDGACRRLDRTGGVGRGPAGIRGARGAACARGPVRSRLSRVGPGAGWREGRGGGGGAGRYAPPSTGHPASGAPWWEVGGRLREVGERRAFILGFKFYLHLRHWATS